MSRETANRVFDIFMKNLSRSVDKKKKKQPSRLYSKSEISLAHGIKNMLHNTDVVCNTLYDNSSTILVRFKTPSVIMKFFHKAHKKYSEDII